MVILEDMNNKPGKHEIKHSYFVRNGIYVIRQRLPVGDYILANDKVQDVLDRKAKRGIPVKMMDLLGTYDAAVDSKNSIQELVGDICGKSHERFRDECILAQNNGIKLFVLVENAEEVVSPRNGIINMPIYQLSDLHKWVNPRLFKGARTATRGITLQKACYTMQKKYDCEFLFCRPDQAGEAIVGLLGGKNG